MIDVGTLVGVSNTTPWRLMVLSGAVVAMNGGKLAQAGGVGAAGAASALCNGREEGQV